MLRGLAALVFLTLTGCAAGERVHVGIRDFHGLDRYSVNGRLDPNVVEYSGIGYRVDDSATLRLVNTLKTKQEVADKELKSRGEYLPRNLFKKLRVEKKDDFGDPFLNRDAAISAHIYLSERMGRY